MLINQSDLLLFLSLTVPSKPITTYVAKADFILPPDSLLMISLIMIFLPPQVLGGYKENYIEHELCYLNGQWAVACGHSGSRQQAVATLASADIGLSRQLPEQIVA